MAKFVILHEKISESPMQRLILCFMANELYDPDTGMDSENRTQAIGWVIDWELIVQRLCDTQNVTQVIDEEIDKFRKGHNDIFRSMQKEYGIYAPYKLSRHVEAFITKHIRDICK